MTYNGRVTAWLEFIMPSPEPKLTGITDDEDKNKSQIELWQAGA
jgi:hypothetical protein